MSDNEEIYISSVFLTSVFVGLVAAMFGSTMTPTNIIEPALIMFTIGVVLGMIPYTLFWILRFIGRKIFK